MITNQFRIKTVDLDGFCGRERHPDRSDIGLVVTAVKMAAVYFDESGGMESPVLHRSELTVPPAFLARCAAGDDTDDGNVLWFYTCVTADGRLLDLIDFELEPVEAGIR